MDWVLPLVVIFSSLLVMNIIAITVHEAGHAIAAYIYTNDKITVFLGSYGDQRRSVKIALGRVEVWIRTNVFMWKGGLCLSSRQKASLRQNFIIILAGPVASLLLFVSLLAIMVIWQPGGLWAPMLLIFCIWSGLIFLYNIVPRGGMIDTGGGDLTHSDGTKLKMLTDSKKMPQEYHEAVDLFNAKNYEGAAKIFDKIIEQGTKNEQVYRMAVGAYIKLKDYRKADQLQKEQVARIGNINARDRINMALLKMLTGRYDEAEKYYLHLLQTGSANKYNLNNYGYLLTLMKRYQDAILYLDKAIAVDSDFAYAWSNRGFAKLMLGWLSDGKADNDRSLELDSTNGYAYRNEGIYLFEKGKYAEALTQFDKAKELEADMPLVDDYIWRATKLLDSD